MDDFEDTSVSFKPKRQATANVSAGTASEDGDYKALNEKRKLRTRERESFDVAILESSESPSEVPDEPLPSLRRTSVIDTRYEDFRRQLFSFVGEGNKTEFSQAMTSLPANVSPADDALREMITGMNILHVALENKQIELAKYIIETSNEELLVQQYKAEIDNKTALHLITELKSLELAKTLLNKLRTKQAQIDAIKAETTVEVKGQRPRSLSSFHLAAFIGCTALVRLYAETGVDVNLLNSKRDTALLWASRWGHLDTVAYLLEKKADCSLENDKNSTALHWAVRYEHYDVVCYLLTKGKADPNQERLQGLVVPIVLAAALGNARITELLLDNGAKVNHVIRSGETPLHVAAKEGNSSVVAVLLQRKATVNQQDDNGNTPLINATSNNHLKCVDLLMKSGANAIIKNHMGNDSWHFALLSDNDDVLRMICKHSINCKIPHLTAAKLGREKKIQVLRQTGIDIRQVDDDGNSLLHYAACYDHDHVITEFCRRVDVNAQNKKGNTALHVACLKGHILSIKALADCKAAGDIPNLNGRLPLHIAAMSPNSTPEIASLLVDYTIKSHAWESLNSFDMNGNNALHLAAEKANPDVLWEFRYVRFKDVDKKGNTPLHDAVRPGNPEVLETMLDIFESMQRDGDINTSNKQKETVLHLVASEGFQDSVSRIVFLGGNLASQDIHGNTVLHRLILEATKTNNKGTSRQIEMVDTILNCATRWWCMRNNLQIPNKADEKYLDYKRQAVIYLIYEITNENNLSVLGLACREAADDILSKLMQIEGVTCYRGDNCTMFDVSFFTAKTFLSPKKSLLGQRVEQAPDSPSKPLIKLQNLTSFLQLLTNQSNKQRAACVLDIPPLKKMEEMFKTVCMVTYLVMMLLHVAYMGVFSYASITLLGKMRNNTDLPNSELLLVYIWVPIEPLVFLVYVLVSVISALRRGDQLASLSYRFILLFFTFSALAVAWLVLVALRNDKNDYVLAVVLCLGWLSTIAFTGGIKGIHYFWRMLRNMVVRDIFRFLVFYTIVWFAFTFAFHAIFQISESIVDTYPTPGDTLFMVFNLMIGMAEIFDDNYEDGMSAVGRSTAYSKVLYMFYIVSSTIILLNLLIAMMNDSYSSILAHERVIWRIDAVEIGMNIEKTIPWITSPFSWLHKTTMNEKTLSQIGERWYVKIIDGEMLTKEGKGDASLAEFIKIELDSQIKNIDKRVAGLENHMKETHQKLDETSNKLDLLIESTRKRRSKKEKKKKKHQENTE